MPRLFSALMTRDEAGPSRFLRQVLRRCQSFSDAILVLDDGSTDDTVQVCEEHGAKVTRRASPTPAWGHESTARQELWELGAAVCQAEDDWILICDADQELMGDPRPLLNTSQVNCWGFTLYDLWSETEYREDQFWRGHLMSRPWMFAPKRVPQGWVPFWGDAGVHPGHAPLNFPMLMGVAPPSIHWRHYAYSTPELRQQKHAAYAAVSDQLSEFQKAHAASILDHDLRLV